MAQNNNQQNNYFTNMARRFNREDFIVLLKPEQIQRSAKERIFREMVRGQIDYAQFGQYYLDPKFLENLIIAADNELKNNIACATALGFYDLTYPGDALIIHNKSKFDNLTVVYTCILQRLQSLKETGNIGYLTDLQFVLANFKYII